ncbi:MAG: hypothetical protein IJ231_04425 [Clostridia bacterium]|nr:hypothetical protein [Clostridia bacterium]
MDIQYLLSLQDFRNSIQDAWTPLMEGVSLFAVHYLILIPLVLKLCGGKAASTKAEG